jgi:glutamate--cysteine ligase
MSAGSLDASLAWLAAVDNRRLLARGLRGIEKECLRVSRDGRLSERPHAREWGSALTHPHITTDYSEALLEFVTTPEEHIETVLECLAELHALVSSGPYDELLWPASMPCIIGTDEAVPIARYGPSNPGLLRTIYRTGLGYRYGRAMQAIAGVHFNYSLPASFWPAYRERQRSELAPGEFKSASLMGLIRNYRRCAWIVTYLFGASPAFCKSFRPQGHARLESLNADTWFAPFSTSLRMSDMGYRNSTQSRLSISVDTLAAYVAELTAAVTSKEPRYEAIGVVVDGEYRQLNANVLQIENEYYSSIRPKPADKNRRLIEALAENGVEYVEVRTLDLNPFALVGIDAEQGRFMECLLIYCLLAESGPIGPAEQEEIDRRELAVAWEGRRPGLSLVRNGEAVALKDWALGIVDDLERIAALLDDGERLYTAAVAKARAAVLEPERTLSARVLDRLTAERLSFFEFAYAIAEEQHEAFGRHAFKPGRHGALEEMARESLRRAAAIEADRHETFEAYLRAYLAVGGRDARG